MKFDWYQASIPEAHPETVMETLSKVDYYGDWERTKPLKGYGDAAQFIVGGEARFRINFGGQNEEYGPNVLGSGGSATQLAQVVREHYPKHRVSRVDSCEDYYHEDVYEYLRKICLKTAKDQKLAVREIVKPLRDSDDGRTLYLGSASSAVQGRLYEKGKQLDSDPHWVRMELQVRPQKDVKAIASGLSAEELWGLSKWSHQLATQIGLKNLQRVDAQIYRPSDHERAYGYMLKQYRKVLEQMKATHGSWEAVGAQIGLDLDRMDLEQEKIALKPVNEFSEADLQRLSARFSAASKK